MTMLHTELPLIETVVTTLVVSTTVAYIFHALKLPSILGYILAGVLIGPSGLSLIDDPSLIQAMAKIGVLFLLFIAGLELSPSKLRELRRFGPLAGGLQLLLSTTLTFSLLSLAGLPAALTFLIAAILALSSTAIVLTSLENLGQLESAHGRLILGVLIIQDLSIIPLLSLIPALTTPEASASPLLTTLWVTGKAILLFALSALLSLKILPNLLDRLASTNRKEVLVLSVVTICLGMAFLTAQAGLSFEAGAFVAGLSLSNTLFSHQIVADSKPFREVFTTLFFVSVGLFLNLPFLQMHWPAVLITTTLLILCKALAGYGAIRLLRFPHHTALWTAGALFQVGEFSFILLQQTAQATGKIPSLSTLSTFWMPLLFSSTVFSMFLTPLVLRALPTWLKQHQDSSHPATESRKQKALEGHVILAGYGPVARLIRPYLQTHEIPYLITEINPQTVKKLTLKGIPCLFGDIARPDILQEAGVQEATLLALTFPDPLTAEVALQTAKRLNPNITCFARARYQNQGQALEHAGASQVIQEETEIANRFLTLIGDHLNLSLEAQTAFQEATGDEHDEETLDFGRLPLKANAQNTNLKMEWLTVHAGSSWIGKTLHETGILETGVTLLAILDATSQEPYPNQMEHPLAEGDLLIVLGTLQALQALQALEEH